MAGIAQSGSVTDAFVHSGDRVGFSRIISCGSEVVLDVCDYLAYCLDDPETHSVILFVEGFKRPERFLALADRALQLGKPIMAVKVGRSDQAQAAAMAHSGSLAGEARVTDAALDAAGVIRCRDLDELLETAELVEGVAADRPAGRSRADRRRDRVDRRGVAHRRPRAADRARPAADPGRGADRRSSRRCRRWATSATRSTRGAPPTRRPRTAPVFEAMAASDAYDVLVLVHDFPYRSLPSEVATANEVTRAAARGDARPTRDPARLRVADLGRAAARDEGRCSTRTGDGAPLLRGALEAFRAIAEVARWEARHAARVDDGPWRPAGRRWRPTGRRSAPTRRSDRRRRRRPPRRALSERESLALRRRRRHRGRRGDPGRRRRRRPWPPLDGSAGAVALKLDAAGLTHKTDLGGVVLGLHGDDAVYAAALDLLETAATTASPYAACSSSRWRRPAWS